MTVGSVPVIEAEFFKDKDLDSNHFAESWCNFSRKTPRFSLTLSVFHNSSYRLATSFPLRLET